MPADDGLPWGSTAKGELSPSSIEAEAAAPQADLFWSSSPNTLGAFKAQFVPYDSPEARAVPRELIELNKLWTACNIHVVVMMVNRNQLGGLPEPKVWKDLLDPRWTGKVILADPSAPSSPVPAPPLPPL